MKQKINELNTSILSWDSTADIVTRRTGRKAIRFSAGTRDFPLFQKPSGPPLGAYLARSSFPEKERRDVKLTTHLHLVHSSRINGAIPLLSLHVLMAWALNSATLQWLCDFSELSQRGQREEFFQWYQEVINLQRRPNSHPDNILQTVPSF